MRSNEAKPKRIPLGLQTFSEVRELACAYVDKTHLAVKLAEEGKVYFLARPRRFGKSLFLDTLRNLFEGKRELFSGLYAEHAWDWSVKYPVVKMDMSGGSANQHELEITLQNNLDNNARSLGVALRGDTNPVRFYNLIYDLRAKYGKPVALLIDEYDKPMIDNIGELELAQQMRKQLHGFYSIIKSADEHLRFVLLTGVSKFSKVSIFSGLNNLEDISLEPQYANVCGYTEHDLDTVFGQHLQGVDREQLRHWYNGYNFLGEERVYNPYDVLNFIKRSQSFGYPQFEDYWFETGTPTFIIELLARNKLPAHQLEPQEVIRAKLDSSPLEKIEFTTALFQSGYLTIDKVISSDVPGLNLYRLTCPNNSVRSSLQNQSFEYYTAGDSISSYQQKMYSALLNADLDTIESELKRLFAGIAADNYRKNNIADFEGYYASVIYSFFVGMGLTVIAEDASSRGRLDMSIQVKDKTYVLEFKVVEHKSSRNSALEQIIAKNYAAKYTGTIYQIGIEFSSDERNIIDFAYQ